MVIQEKIKAKLEAKIEAFERFRKLKEPMVFEDSYRIDSIVGLYFLDDYYTHLSKGFYLKNTIPKLNIGVYNFKFCNNGSLVFKDLTAFYSCGNGIRKFHNGSWKKLEDGKYLISFDEKILKESHDHIEAIYKLNTLPDGDKKLVLLNILVKDRIKEVMLK